MFLNCNYHLFGVFYLSLPTYVFEFCNGDSSFVAMKLNPQIGLNPQISPSMGFKILNGILPS